MKEIKCKSGGAYRSQDGEIVETCAYCLLDMPYNPQSGEFIDGIRPCLGKCPMDCDYQIPYGFVPEVGCPIHDTKNGK